MNSTRLGGSKSNTMKGKAHKQESGNLVKEGLSVLIGCGYLLANIIISYTKDRTLCNQVIDLSNLQHMISRNDHKGSLE